MHYRDDDPSGTAPKTKLYETEPGMSVESAMALSHTVSSVEQYLMDRRLDNAFSNSKTRAKKAKLSAIFFCGSQCASIF